MRKTLFVLAAGALLFAFVSPAAAQIYPWCAIYSGALGGAENCGFTSRQQCEANVRGAGGFCHRNPLWQPPSQRPRRDRRQRDDN